MTWWMVTVNGKIYCTEARSASDAVFGVLRRLECAGIYYTEGGNLWWQQVHKPRNMTKKLFKELVEGKKPT